MHTFKKSKIKMSGLYLVYNQGSVYEEEGKSGTMHLMEHLLCKTFDDLRDEFTKRGIVYNAFTSSQLVVVWFNGLSKQLDNDLKKVLVQRLTGGLSLITKDAFEKEKMVVLQEYEDNFANPISGTLINIMRQRYNDDMVIGQREDIENFSYDDMFLTYDKCFRRPAQIIEIGGDKTNFDFVEYNDEPLSKKRLKYGKYSRPISPVPTAEGVSFLTFLCTKPVNKKDYVTLGIARSMMSNGLNSPLYEEIREKRGLVYDIYSDIEAHVNDSIFYTCFQTMPEYVDEAQEVYADMMNNLEKYMSRQRFEDIIEMYRNKLEKSNIYIHEYFEKFIKGLPDCKLTPAILDKIAYEDVVEVAKKYMTSYEVFVD